METIRKKVKGKKLTEFTDLNEMVEYAWSVVHDHCKEEFYDSWESIARMSTDIITEEFFFRNYLWCVYVSGFSAKAVTANFDRLMSAHNLVDSHGRFVPSEKAQPPCKEKVFGVWKNHAKFNAIFETRSRVREGWPPFRKKFLDSRSPVDIQQIPFMGPALSRHLARNLGGVQIVKPDVHMVRLTKKFLPSNAEWWETGLDETERLCLAASNSFQRMKDWPLGKVDLLLWYASATLRS
jgi:hypothetical protein